MSKEDNLTPFTPENAAIMGSKGGKAKAGSKHLSTIIREIGDNLDWTKTTLKNKEQLQQQYGNNGWKAVVYVAWTKAMTGDPQAMKWLAENGFGKNIDLTTNGEALPTVIIENNYGRKPTFRISNDNAETDDLAKDSSGQYS